MSHEVRVIKTFVVSWATTIAPFVSREFDYKWEAEDLFRIVNCYTHLTTKPQLRTQCRYI